MNTAQNPTLETSRKLLYVGSNSDLFRKDISKNLEFVYTVRLFADTSGLERAVKGEPPAALILDDMIPPKGGINVISHYRSIRRYKSLPIVFAIDQNDRETIANAKTYNGVECLIKPYSVNDLQVAISRAASAGVEAEWKTIEPVQRQALTQTLHSFNAIADMINDEQPVVYEDVRESCGPLVNAVSDGNYKDMLRGVQDHDNYSFVHSLRVATFLSLFGHAIGIRGEDLMTLSTGGLLHDVGKMFIPHEVLNKAGKLSDDEFTVMKSHVTHTNGYLGQTDLPRGVIVIAGQHHEKLDGTGYPDGLKGTEINQLARMAAIVDVFGALTDKRVYKEAMEPEKALGMMSEWKNHLDQELLGKFREMLLDAATID